MHRASLCYLSDHILRLLLTLCICPSPSEGERRESDEKKSTITSDVAGKQSILGKKQSIRTKAIDIQ